MRFNKTELAALASHPSHQFDKEGVLLLRERHDGFFRRTEGGDVVVRRKGPLRELSCVTSPGKVSTERWCRLRGNLLFYFKSRDHWSEPAGVIVLENCQVTLDPGQESPYAFTLVFEGGVQHCAALTESERDVWITAIHQASFAYMRAQVEALQQQVNQKMETLPVNIQHHRLTTGVTLGNGVRGKSSFHSDVNEPPFLEMCVSCDNLRCDGDGQPPSPRVIIHVLTPPNTTWIHYAETEVIERTSNPSFLSTVSFRLSDGLESSTRVRLSVYDVRERVTNTATQLGQAVVSLGGIREALRTRLTLQSPSGRTVGFVTISAWTLEPEAGDNVSHTPSNATPQHEMHQSVACHRRTQSLPPRLSSKTRHPTQGQLSLLYDNPAMATYRLHSGLGGDISVLEVMAESRYSFLIPQQLICLWINEERQYQEELSSLGDLSDKWHSRQMSLLNQHLTLINIYSMALDTLQAHIQNGPSFKKSVEKGESSLEFVPTNLHLQRMWAQNESLRRSGFYDVITVGAFSAESHGFKKGGLVNMLHVAKSSSRTPGGGDKAGVSETAVEGIKRLRLEVTGLLRAMILSLREEDPGRLKELLLDLQEKAKLLMNIMESSLVEEAFEFLDQIRVPQNPSRVLTLATRNYSAYDIEGYLSPEAALDLELKSPEVPSHDFKICDPVSPCEGVTTVREGEFIDAIGNNCYRPTDEPEPWDLIQLNVQASVMCLTSKIKSFSTKLESRKDKADKDNQISVGSGNQSATNSQMQDSKNASSKESSFINQSNCGAITKSSPHHQVTGSGRKTLSDSQINVKNEKVSVSEPQAISSAGHGKSGQDSIASSASPEVSSVSIQSDISTTAPTSRSQSRSHQSSCTATPDVSPCEEDSGIGLEKPVGEMERGDCISEGGLSVDEEKKEELLPLDKLETKKDEKSSENETVVNTAFNDSKVITPEVVSNKSGGNKLESIMEQSCEDLNGHSGDEGSPEEVKCKEKDDVITVEPKVESENDESISKVESVPQEDILESVKNQETKQEIKQDNEVIDIDWHGEVRPSMKKLRQAMDGLLRTARLVHSVFRLQQTPEAAQLTHSIKYRRDVCFSQALTSLITALMTRLWCRKADPLFLTVLAHMGPLAEFESLLSYHGQEASRFNDMIVAVEDLGTVEFVLVASPFPKKSRTKSEGAPTSPSVELPKPVVTGNRCGLRIVLPTPEHIMSLLPNTGPHPTDPPTFRVTPVFFSVGINEEATLAEKLGADSAQMKNNQDSYERLAQYYHRFKKLPLPQETNRRGSAVSSEIPLAELIERLDVEVQRHKSKNVAILELGSQCCRTMAGVRFTSCKSAKDRTSMSVTLEQARILAAEYDLAETEFQRALNCMRSEGTRLENCHKNIGQKRYAFTALQLATFPKLYRPPPGTYGAKYT